MAWIKGRSPGDYRWYLVYLACPDGSRMIFPALADPGATNHWGKDDQPGEGWEDYAGLVTHYHKIEPWPDPPTEGE